MSCKIRSWKVSYYQNDHRRWVHGQLTCSPYSVSFHMDNVSQSVLGDHHDQACKETVSEQESADLMLHYADIKQVQKAKSMLIYHAVTVETFEGVVYWFSSLPDRYSVYSTLDYFRRHHLLDSSTSSMRKPFRNPATKTRIGQQLLQSAEDSERTLAEAAANLYGQGRQLDGASIRLQEIHEDLDVADRLLSGLNSYLGQWSLPAEYTEVEAIRIHKDDTSSDQDLEVLSSELSKNQWRPQELCILRVTESGMALLTPQQRLRHSLPWMDLSRVFVVSPWEVVLTKHVLGAADVSVSVVSSALLPVLELLGKKVSHLMDYQTPPASAATVVTPERDRRSSRKELTSGRVSSGDTHSFYGNASFKDGNIIAARDIRNSGFQQQQEGKQEQDVVSEAELHALRSKLGGLKMMATAVGDELATQNETLDKMIDSVDHVDSRICDATKRTKKLM